MSEDKKEEAVRYGIQNLTSVVRYKPLTGIEDIVVMLAFVADVFEGDVEEEFGSESDGEAIKMRHCMMEPSIKEGT